MGSVARTERRRLERQQKEWNKPFTTTKKAYMELATQEANKLYEEMKAELTKEIGESLMYGVAKVFGLITASALEETYGFGIKRIGKVIGSQLRYVADMSNATINVDILEHEKYWKEKGLHITDSENGEVVMRIGRD